MTEQARMCPHCNAPVLDVTHPSGRRGVVNARQTTIVQLMGEDGRWLKIEAAHTGHVMHECAGTEASRVHAMGLG